MIFRTIVSLTIVLALTVLIVPYASAHGGEPRLEISVERVNPGGVIELRGVDFDYDEPVVLSLIRSQFQIPLMEVTADGEGIFTQIIVLPSDLPAGEYNFRAKSDHHLVTSSTITIWGVAGQEQEDTEVREQSDLQLGPVPTLAIAPGAAPTPVPQAAPLEAPASRGSSTTLIYSILLGAGIVALLGIRILKKR